MQAGRVLIVHNAYTQRGGEDAVVEAEEALLVSRGHEVLRFERHNDEIAGMSRLAMLRDTVWSTQSAADLSAAVRHFSPDVVHVHNIFPLVSPSIYWAASGAHVPVVQTIHNFRLICPQAMLLREGRVCEDCVGRVPWRAIRHRCYRDSAAQSAVVALMLQTHRALGTWRDKVALYIALNEFCEAKLIEGGIPAERIRVKPNFLDHPPPATGERRGLLFVGRLSPEKGVAVLAEAMTRLGGRLSVRVVGEGPAAGVLAAIPGVTMLGPLAPADVYREMQQAQALVLPSIWYENFPRTLVEAYANGLPVVASRLGAMAELVVEGQTGVLFTPGDAEELVHALSWLAEHPDEARAMGLRGRAKFEAHYQGDANYRMLMNIYEEACRGRQKGVRALAPIN